MSMPPRTRRRRLVTTAVAACALVALSLAPSALAAGNATVAFASGTTWLVSDGDVAVGPTLDLPAAAQPVCLNDSWPNPCPAGATTYGWPGAGWSADLSGIPGATWIWAPGIDGTTAPADSDVYRFARTFVLPGTPVSGSISVAADDGAEVWVNGTLAGSTSSSGAMATIDITALLVEGDNTIVVEARNGLICGQACSYAQNPGGTVFGGSLTYSPSEVAAPTNAPTVPPTSTVGPSERDTPAGGAALLPVLVAALLLVAGAGRRARVRS